MKKTPIPPGYQPLRRVLNLALEQSALGKGRERHADEKPFLQQPILATTRTVGLGFALGQAMKKAGESAGMVRRGNRSAARAEILGAIVYLAAAYIYLEEEEQNDQR